MLSFFSIAGKKVVDYILLIFTSANILAEARKSAQLSERLQVVTSAGWLEYK